MGNCFSDTANDAPVLRKRLDSQGATFDQDAFPQMISSPLRTSQQPRRNSDSGNLGKSLTLRHMEEHDYLDNIVKNFSNNFIDVDFSAAPGGVDYQEGISRANRYQHLIQGLRFETITIPTSPLAPASNDPNNPTIQHNDVKPTSADSEASPQKDSENENSNSEGTTSDETEKNDSSEAGADTATGTTDPVPGTADNELPEGLPNLIVLGYDDFQDITARPQLDY